MGMQLQHSFTVPAGPDRAWAVLMDLERVGNCFPGATVTEASADSFAGSVKVKLGPIALVYSGSGSFLERDDNAHRAVIEAKGKDKRGNGTAGALVSVALHRDSADATRVEVVTDLSITGKPAQFGRGVMQDVSDKLLQQFVACVEAQFGSDDAPPVTEPVERAHNDRAGEPPAAAFEARASRPAPATDPAALDLTGALGPMLAKRVMPHALSGSAGLLLGLLIGVHWRRGWRARR